jgi:hypothetical protein
MNKNNNRNVDENIQDVLDQARSANTRATRAAMQAKKKNAGGKHERSKPGRVKALNRSMDHMVLQEKKRTNLEAQLANLTAKYIVKEFHARNQSTFFANKLNEQESKTPLLHRMRHNRHK